MSARCEGFRVDDVRFDAHTRVTRQSRSSSVATSSQQNELAVGNETSVGKRCRDEDSRDESGDDEDEESSDDDDDDDTIDGMHGGTGQAGNTTGGDDVTDNTTGDDGTDGADTTGLGANETNITAATKRGSHLRAL